MIFRDYTSKQSAMRALRKFGIKAKDAHKFIERHPFAYDPFKTRNDLFRIALDHCDDSNNSLYPVEVPAEFQE